MIFFTHEQTYSLTKGGPVRIASILITLAALLGFSCADVAQENAITASAQELREDFEPSEAQRVAEAEELTSPQARVARLGSLAEEFAAEHAARETRSSSIAAERGSLTNSDPATRYGWIRQAVFANSEEDFEFLRTAGEPVMAPEAQRTHSARQASTGQIAGAFERAVRAAQLSPEQREAELRAMRETFGTERSEAEVTR